MLSAGRCGIAIEQHIRILIQSSRRLYLFRNCLLEAFSSVSTAGISSSSASSRAKSCCKRNFSAAGTGRREPPLPAYEQPKACAASRTSLCATHRCLSSLAFRLHSLRTQGWNELAPACTNLFAAHLEGAYLPLTNLKKTNLTAAYLQGTQLFLAHLEGASLQYAHLEGATLSDAHLQGAALRYAQLEGANFFKAHLEGADLEAASLKGQIVPKSDWEQVRRWAWDPFLSANELSPANLRSAFFDTATNLDKVILGEKRYGFVFLVDIHWGGTNLSVVNWASVSILGDDREARQHKMAGGKTKDKTTRLKEYQTAVRANRQLAAALRDQGLNEEAIRFAYQAQRLQRVVFRRQMLERGIAFSFV